MPTFIDNPDIWAVVWPAPVLSVIIGLILATIVWLKTRKFIQPFFLISSIALLGCVTGQLTGHSRDPAVDAVLPAILTLVGGLVIYLFSKEDISLQLMTASSVVGLSFSLLIGTYWGAHLRAEYESANAQEQAEREKIMASKEYRLTLEEIEHAINLKKLLNENEIAKYRRQLKALTDK